MAGVRTAGPHAVGPRVPTQRVDRPPARTPAIPSSSGGVRQRLGLFIAGRRHGLSFLPKTASNMNGMLRAAGYTGRMRSRVRLRSSGGFPHRLPGGGRRLLLRLLGFLRRLLRD